MPSFKTEIRAQIHDLKTGRLIYARPWQPANSLLKQFIQVLMVQLSQITQTVTDVGGTGRSSVPHAQLIKANGAATVTTYGIVIGSGTTLVTMTDHALETQLTTNIAHGATTFSVENPDSSTWRLAVMRTFTNNTGALLQIKEAGLYAYVSGYPYFGCLDRTLYPVDCGAGAGVTLTYRLTVTL